jgi:hypothetical protein
VEDLREGHEGATELAVVVVVVVIYVVSSWAHPPSPSGPHVGGSSDWESSKHPERLAPSPPHSIGGCSRGSCLAATL